ncbi:MAG TPA: hypothetical protein VL137_03975 [Polyangiaceae bacterium]|nr:hypothetical protein [Polyangiaceae bacterium]
MRSPAALLRRSSLGPSFLCRLIVCATCWASFSRAQTEVHTAQTVVTSRPRVVLVQPSADNSELAEAPTRIRAELEAAGFDVEIVEGDANLAPRDQLDRVAQQARPGPTPVATIVLASAGTSADIWVADRVTAKTTVRRIDIAQTSQAASILAVRTVELLRASLLETQAAHASQPPPAPKQPRRPAPPRPTESPSDQSAIQGALDLGAVGLFGLNGFTPHLGPALRISAGTLDVKGRLTLAAPILGGRLSEAQGSAMVRPLLGQLDVVASVPVQRTMRLYGSLGFGGYVLPVHGEASAPALAHDKTATGGTLQIGVGLQAMITPRFGLFVDPQLMWFLPEVAIRIANEQAGRIGAPAFGANLGLSWTF